MCPIIHGSAEPKEKIDGNDENDVTERACRIRQIAPIHNKIRNRTAQEPEQSSRSTRTDGFGRAHGRHQISSNSRNQVDDRNFLHAPYLLQPEANITLKVEVENDMNHANMHKNWQDKPMNLSFLNQGREFGSQEKQRLASWTDHCVGGAEGLSELDAANQELRQEVQYIQNADYEDEAVDTGLEPRAENLPDRRQGRPVTATAADSKERVACHRRARHRVLGRSGAVIALRSGTGSAVAEGVDVRHRTRGNTVCLTGVKGMMERVLEICIDVKDPRNKSDSSMSAFGWVNLYYRSIN